MHRRLACLITWLARSSTRDSEFNWLSLPSLSLCCYSWALSDNWRSTLIGLSVSSCLVRCSFSSGSLHTSLQCENKTHIYYYFFIAYIFHHKWIITFHWFHYFRFQSRSALTISQNLWRAINILNKMKKQRIFIPSGLLSLQTHHLGL